MAIAADNPATNQPAPNSAVRPLRRFWRPRYWPAWALVSWMKITSLLPWRFAVRLHKRIGRLCWRLMARHRKIVEHNIELSFPELDAVDIERLVLRHFENLGACLAEAAFAWFGKVNQSRINIEIEGDEHVYTALARGRGVILYTGHFTSMEVCGPILNQTFPHFGFMFHRRRNELIDVMQERGRQRESQMSIPNDNVRAMLRALANNSVVWYAPDQCVASRSTAVLPFLGVPQSVTTSTSRLARASGAAVIPLAYRRLSDDSGYQLRFESELQDVATGDEKACTRRLLEVLERFVKECPDQYAWTRRRLKQQPAELSVAGQTRRRAFDHSGG